MGLDCILVVSNIYVIKYYIAYFNFKGTQKKMICRNDDCKYWDENICSLAHIIIGKGRICIDYSELWMY